MLLVIVDSIDTWTESLSGITMLRIIMSAMGYTLRPLTILSIIMIAIRSKNINYRLLYIPAIINGFVAFSALFSDVAFSYSEDNQFVRGPLGYCAYIVSISYLLILAIVTIHHFRERHLSESLIIFSIHRQPSAMC